MTNEEMTEKGRVIFGELMGGGAADAMANVLANRGFGGDLAEMACQFAFASVWGREGLERKQRSLVTLGVLIAQRQNAELKNHVRIALNNGLTVRELEETLIQTAPYVGFPAIASATTTMVEVLHERGIATDTKTFEERGLL